MPDSKKANQEKAKAALGGSPTKPADFRPIGEPAVKQVPAAKPALPQAPARKVHPTFDADQEVNQLRSFIENSRSQLGALVQYVDGGIDRIQATLDKIKTDDGKKVAEKLDFDTGVAEDFIKELDAVIEKYKPRA